MTMFVWPLIYVAAPYTYPDPIVNTRDAIAAADEILDSGLAYPYVPHLTMLWHLVTPRDIEHWYQYDLQLLFRCDALLRLPGESTGADGEVEFALDHEIPVVHNVEEALVIARRLGPKVSA